MKTEISFNTVNQVELTPETERERRLLQLAVDGQAVARVVVDGKGGVRFVFTAGAAQE